MKNLGLIGYLGCWSILIAGCASPSPQPVTVSTLPTVAATTSAVAPAPITAAPSVLPSTIVPTTVVPPPTVTPATADDEVALMPDVTCMNLQAAQDLIQAAGVFFSRSQDASGAGRKQVIDSNWTVVSQSPPAGSPIGEGDAMLSAVKLGEPGDCS